MNHPLSGDQSIAVTNNPYKNSSTKSRQKQLKQIDKSRMPNNPGISSKAKHKDYTDPKNDQIHMQRIVKNKLRTIAQLLDEVT